MSTCLASQSINQWFNVCCSTIFIQCNINWLQMTLDHSRFIILIEIFSFPLIFSYFILSCNFSVAYLKFFIRSWRRNYDLDFHRKESLASPYIKVSYFLEHWEKLIQFLIRTFLCLLSGEGNVILILAIIKFEEEKP